MEQIKVLVHGAAGRVGQEVVKAVGQAVDMKLVGGVEVKVTSPEIALPDGTTVPFSDNLEDMLNATGPDVMVDFTIARASMPAVRTTTGKGVNLVIGTTGFTADELKEMERLATSNKIGIIAAPNFALGAVLMIHLAKIAGKYMDHAEIIEQHHDRKLDAPSGTSRLTAQAMAEARGKSFLPPAVAGEGSPSRGRAIEGINIHSVRLPGFMAHQEVILGTDGQTLRIRHDQISREAFMPGVLIAIREAVKRPGFIYGLDKLLGL
jgi:4-hydroxy-tetrahydrodipicolinate reductase